MTGMSRAARGFATLVACAGVAACVAVVPHVRNWDYVVGLALLWVVLSSLSMANTSRGSVTVSLGFVISVAAIFLTGLPGAILVPAAGVLEYHRSGLPLLKRAFNGAQFALAGGASGLVYAALSGPVGTMDGNDFPGILLTTVACVAAYLVANYCLLAAVIHLDSGMPFLGVWWSGISWATSSFFAYGLLGLLLAMMWENVNPVAALLLMGPLLVARATYGHYAQLQKAYEATLRALIQAVETKDYYTRGHSERVAAASVLIAREVGMREDRVEALRYAGMLHDVGKTGVPTKVLQKTGRLTEDEAEAIRQHTTRGYELLREIDFLSEALAGIYHHHERLDGMGYPQGLSGYDIPEFARVIAVADAFDSMTSTRSYRPAKPVDAAVVELLRCKGSQFDPLFVDALVRAVERKGWQTTEAPSKPEEALIAVSAAEGPTASEHDA